MTTHSLATMIFDASALRGEALTDHRAEMAPVAETLRFRLARLRRLASLCRRACGLARAGDSVVLVAPVGTSPDEVAGGLADEGSGEWRERVEVVTASDAAEWERLYAEARQRSGWEVCS